MSDCKIIEMGPKTQDYQIFHLITRLSYQLHLYDNIGKAKNL